MDIKELTSWLGIEATSLDEFKKSFEQKYKTSEQFFKSDELKDRDGKLFGTQRTALNRIGKAYGIEITKDEIDGKPAEDITEMFLKKTVDLYEGKLTDLKKVADSGTDEKVKEIQSRYEKLEGKYKDTETQWKNTVSEFDEFKKVADQKVKGIKLDYVKSNVWGQVKFDPSVDPLKKKGFESIINETYIIDLDENDNPYIKTKDGKQIPSPDKHGTFKTIEEVLNMEADKAGLLSKNPNAGRPAFQVQMGGGQPQRPAPEPVPGRKIAARAKV